jgi:hypothetical protein
MGVSAVPQAISYQGILKEADGTPVPDGIHMLVFSLYDTGAGGSPLWSETKLVQTTDGVFNVILGSMTALDLPFDTQYWLAVSVSGEAEMSPRIKLTSAPYAL